MLSVFHQISVEMAWFCRVWFAKCVDGKENLSLFACFFTLCPDIVPYTYRGDDKLSKSTYMAKSEISNVRRLVTLLCAILSAMEWQVSRWRLRIWSVLHANSPTLTAHLLSERTGVVSVGLLVSVSGAGNCDSKKLDSVSKGNRRARVEFRCLRDPPRCCSVPKRCWDRSLHVYCDRTLECQCCG